MNLHFFSRPMVLVFLALLTIISCITPAAVPSASPQSPAAQNTETNPESTATIQPTLTLGSTQEITGTSPNGSCSVLQDLNLRIGPGTAYRPIIRVLPANSVVTPLGYAPQGFRGGAWAYVQNSTTQDKGWVSAGPQYISCDVELATLPPVAFGTPPPAPLPKTAQASPGPGTCGDGGVVAENGVDVYDCIVNFYDDTLLKLTILKNGQEIGQTEGVQNVVFTVSQNDTTIYTYTDDNYAYCIFGGDNSCDPWLLEDYIYKWETGGQPVQVGKYTVSIVPNLDDASVNLFWSAEITMALP